MTATLTVKAKHQFASVDDVDVIHIMPKLSMKRAAVDDANVVSFNVVEFLYFFLFEERTYTKFFLMCRLGEKLRAAASFEPRYVTPAEVR